MCFSYWIAKQLECALFFYHILQFSLPTWFYVISLSIVAQYVPKPLLDQHGITLNKSVEMQDHNGKVWQLSITHLRDGRTVITQGWRDFLEQYNLNTQKDELELEIIRGRGSDCKDLKVRIIKRVTPRGRGRPREPKDIRPRGPGRPRKMK